VGIVIRMRQGYGILINTITGTYMIMGRILIVEHEEHVRRTVGLVLRQGGYEVIEVMDGEQAILTIQAETQNHAVSAIICDLGLPQSSGKEVITFIRAKLPSVPIIVLTGYPDVQAAASLFKQGVVDYLVKPAQAQTLLDSVRRAINEQALLG
jgi:Response regulator containing CheY-like receiver, AAA-type ATPase, and DNA-binding domains